MRGVDLFTSQTSYNKLQEYAFVIYKTQQFSFVADARDYVCSDSYLLKTLELIQGNNIIKSPHGNPQ